MPEKGSRAPSALLGDMLADWDAYFHGLCRYLQNFLESFPLQVPGQPHVPRDPKEDRHFTPAIQQFQDAFAEAPAWLRSELAGDPLQAPALPSSNYPIVYDEDAARFWVAKGGPDGDAPDFWSLLSPEYQRVRERLRALQTAVAAGRHKNAIGPSVEGVNAPVTVSAVRAEAVPSKSAGARPKAVSSPPNSVGDIGGIALAPGKPSEHRHAEAQPDKTGTEATDWARYRDKYRTEKLPLEGFPDGRVNRVTVSRRNGAVILRWRQGGKQRREVIGRLDDAKTLPRALLRASEINRDLEGDSRAASFAEATVAEACDIFLASKESSPDVCGKTIEKYRSGLHRVKEFCELPERGGGRKLVSECDTAWCESFCAWLDGVKSTRNGAPPTPGNPERPLSMALKREIRQRLWSVFEHARLRTPPLVPAAFRNPIPNGMIGRKRREMRGVSEPPVSLDDLAKIATVCDHYQLGLLAMLFAYGPRPSELGRILRADYDESTGFLRMICRPKCGYQTKGRQDKAWPVTPALAASLRPFLLRGPGVLFVKRAVFERTAGVVLAGATEDMLAREYEDRLAAEAKRLRRQPGKVEAERIADVTWAAAGAVDARDVARELANAARKAGLARCPTPKDVRHLVESECEAARLSPGVIRQLLGHAPVRGDSLVNYNHTGRGTLTEQVKLLDERRAGLLAIMAARAQELEQEQTAGNGSVK